MTKTSAREHITTVLEKLHWLPVSFCVDFKILMLTYKALNNLAPQYLSELLTPYTPTRVLRSSEAGLLTVQTTRLKTLGDPAFSSLAPKLRNSLPSEIRNALSVFKLSLKIDFFGVAFMLLIWLLCVLLYWFCIVWLFFNGCTFVCIFLHACQALWDVTCKCAI